MKYLSYGVMVYMLMALIWWAILLSGSNAKIYRQQFLLLDHGVHPGITDVTSNDSILKYPALASEYNKKRKMIIGEGIVFGFSLVLGMYLIQKAYTNQIRTNRNQKNFMLSVSHELKTPITAINLLAGTLQKREVDRDMVRELSGDILAENLRLEKLVSNLLLATRLGSHIGLNFETVDVKQIINEVVSGSSRQWPGARIVFENDNAEPMPVICDHDAMVSIFTNLVDNAVKYSESSAQVKIKAKISGAWAEFSVADQGIGIPATEKPNITKLFYRVGPEETRRTKGTGIGLYIVSKLVNAHSGTLSVEDNQPKGTIFRFKIPTIQKSK